MVNIVSSLAYLPEQQIKPTFYFFKTFFVSLCPAICSFLEYFERFWLKRIHQWCLYGREVTTNNVCEGFNNKLKNRFGRRRNNISSFLVKLKSLIQEVEADIFRAETGAERPSKEKKRDIKKRELINNSYEELFVSGPLTFLFKVATIRCSFRKLKCLSPQQFTSIFFDLLQEENTFSYLNPSQPPNFLTSPSTSNLLASSFEPQSLPTGSLNVHIPLNETFDYVPSLPINFSYNIEAPRSIEPLLISTIDQNYNANSIQSPNHFENSSFEVPNFSSFLSLPTINSSSFSSLPSTVTSSCLSARPSTIPSTLPSSVPSSLPSSFPPILPTSLSSFQPICHPVDKLIEYLENIGQIKNKVLKKLKYLAKRQNFHVPCPNPFIIDSFVCSPSLCRFPTNCNEVYKFINK